MRTRSSSAAPHPHVDASRPLVDRLDGVLDEVVEHAPQLVLVGRQPRHVGRDVEREGDVARGRHRLPEIDQPLQERRQRDGAKIEPLLAGEIEKVLDEAVEPAHLGHDPLGRRGEIAARTLGIADHAPLNELRLHRQPGERVAEIVDDAGRDGADVGEPLALLGEAPGLLELAPPWRAGRSCRG